VLNFGQMDDLEFLASSWSTGGADCVEVCRMPDGRVAVRDSKNREGPLLTFTSPQWARFVADIKNKEFDAG